MMYLYITLADETQVTHSHTIERGGEKEVEVHFERPTDDGFDSARCVLPSYEWINISGYNEEDLAFFQEFLRFNAHLLFRYGESGGVDIA